MCHCRRQAEIAQNKAHAEEERKKSLLSERKRERELYSTYMKHTGVKGLRDMSNKSKPRPKSDPRQAAQDVLARAMQAAAAGSKGGKKGRYDGGLPPTYEG